MISSMSELVVLWTLFLLQVKHLIIDWIFQPPYEHQNKHIFGHWGGIRHALKNAVGTGAAVALGFFLTLPFAVILLIVLVDFVVHYLTDFAKTNTVRKFSFGPTTCPQFWWLTGFDQFVHQITYIGLVYYAVAQFQ